jgi:DNA-binding transcriptional LysR family regulator
MIDLNELQFFVHLSRTQSFTVAAKYLGVPKSTVSRAIVRLESRLGVRLVGRTTRSVSLTEAGQLYLERCERMLEEAEQADLLMGALQAKPRGKLRVGAPVMFARAILGPILGDFLARYPDLRLHLHIISGQPGADEKALDLVIRSGPLEDSALFMTPIMRVRLGVYASPKYLKHKIVPESPAELRKYSCITTNCGTFREASESILWRLRRGSDLQEVRVEPRASAPDPVITHQLALSGAGVVLLSQGVAQSDVERGRLVRLLPDWEPEPVELFALYPSRLNSSPKVRAFLEFLRERSCHSLKSKER